MTVLGYFDIYLSQEIVRRGDDGVDEMSTNWTKRYLFKSLQYIGPVAMGIGSFILIIACVITLENRDKNTQVLHNVKEVETCKKKSLLQREIVQRRLPMTDEEVRDWTPRYKAVPLLRRNSSPMMGKQRKYRSTPCIPQMLFDTIDNRRLYGRFLDTYYCGIFDAENNSILDAHGHSRDCVSIDEYCFQSSPWQDVTVELHSPPSTPFSSTAKSSALRISPINSPQPNPSSLRHVCNFRRTSDLAHNENNSSNIFVTIDPATSTAISHRADSAVGVRCFAQDDCAVQEGVERHAPLASLDIEFGTSSSSSSSNVKVSNVNSFFSI
uniref:Uncharacterized protein n=1 Tax=Setaria digitata TaxID=48799 RepID=A0A915PWM2_9BILA